MNVADYFGDDYDELYTKEDIEYTKNRTQRDMINIFKDIVAQVVSNDTERLFIIQILEEL